MQKKSPSIDVYDVTHVNKIWLNIYIFKITKLNIKTGRLTQTSRIKNKGVLIKKKKSDPNVTQQNKNISV